MTQLDFYSKELFSIIPGLVYKFNVFDVLIVAPVFLILGITLSTFSLMSFSTNSELNLFLSILSWSSIIGSSICGGDYDSPTPPVEDIFYLLICSFFRLRSSYLNLVY